MDRDALLAKCDELLVFLAAHNADGKLLRLKEDIEALRDRLLKQVRAGEAQAGVDVPSPHSAHAAGEHETGTSDP